MTGGGPASGEGERAAARRDRWVVVILIEAAALMIAIAMPFTPSKTGSTWSLAELLWPDPSLLQEVAVYFVATNVLIACLGVVVWILHLWERRGQR